jgi:glycosyltransferase involved in cell wall biosynthesis
MKVLHFFKTALPATFGGVEQVIDQICRSTNTHGIKSSVLALTISSTYPKQFEFNGYKVHLVKRDFQFAGTDFAVSAFSRFCDLAKENDIIHYHFPWPFMDIAHFVASNNKPSLVTYHSDIIRQKNLLKLYQPLMNTFLSSVDKIIATSPNYMNSSLVLKRYKNKTSIIPIGLEKDSYPIPNILRIEHWKKRFNFGFFLFIGVLRYYKGLHVLLEANQYLDIPVVIVGDGPLKESLMADSMRRNLQNTYFLGSIDDEDKVILLTLCFGLIFPSNLRSEAFGISLLEGAMYGKPLISCEIGTGTSFINLNNVTGIVVPPNNAQALQRAMLELWNDSDKAARLGTNASLHFNKFFTAKKMAEQYADIYHDLAS